MIAEIVQYTKGKVQWVFEVFIYLISVHAGKHVPSWGTSVVICAIRGNLIDNQKYICFFILYS